MFLRCLNIFNIPSTEKRNQRTASVLTLSIHAVLMCALLVYNTCSSIHGCYSPTFTGAALALILFYVFFFFFSQSENLTSVFKDSFPSNKKQSFHQKLCLPDDLLVAFRIWNRLSNAPFSLCDCNKKLLHLQMMYLSLIT